MSYAEKDFPVYCNSLLATLNARRIIQENMDDVMSMSLQGATKKTTTQSVIGTTQWASICDEPDFFFPFLTKHLYQPMANNISIRIDTTQQLVRDGIRDQVRGDFVLVLTRRESERFS